MTDIRDAFILWMVGNISAIIASLLQSYSADFSLPVRISTTLFAGTLYIVAATFICAGIASFVAGVRAVRAK